MIIFYPIAEFESLEQFIESSGNDKLLQRFKDNREAIIQTKKQLKYSRTLPTTYMRRSKKELQSELALRSKTMRGIAQSAGYGKYAPTSAPPPPPSNPNLSKPKPKPPASVPLPTPPKPSAPVRADMPLNPPVARTVPRMPSNVPQAVPGRARRKISPYAIAGAAGLGLGIAGQVGYNLYRNRNKENAE